MKKSIIVTFFCVFILILGLLSCVFSNNQMPDSDIKKLKGKIAVMDFSKEIDNSSCSELINTLKMVEEGGAKEIYLNVSGVGGDSEEAFRCYEFIHSLKTPVITHCTGQVSSASVVIFLAGAKRYSVPGGAFFIHKARASFSSELVEIGDLKAKLESLILAQKNYERIISINSKIPAEKLESVFSGTTLSADQALDYGIIQEIKLLPKEDEDHVFIK